MCMTHDELIERMARAIDPYAWTSRMSAPPLDARRDASRCMAKTMLRTITDTGYAVVPVEATDMQLSAGHRAGLDDPTRKSSTLYRAMVAAGRIDGETDASSR